MTIAVIRALLVAAVSLVETLSAIAGAIDACAVARAIICTRFKEAASTHPALVAHANTVGASAVSRAVV